MMNPVYERIDKLTDADVKEMSQETINLLKDITVASQKMARVINKYELAKHAYIELTNNRDHANNCYFADNKLMDKFDIAFQEEQIPYIKIN